MGTFDAQIMRQRILKRMGEMGLSQADVADSAGISRSGFNDILMKKEGRSPRCDILWSVADVLQLSLDYLAGRTGDSELAPLLQSPRIQELLEGFRDLSAQEQEKILDIVNLMRNAGKGESSNSGD